MILANVKCEYVKASASDKKKITAGMIGAQISVSFNSDWDGLEKTAVFRNGNVVRDVLNIGPVVDVPWEVLEKPGNWLEVSFYGTNGDGSFALPSLWVRLGPVNEASDPSGDPGADPTLPPWVGIHEEMEEFRQLNGAVKQNTEDITVQKQATAKNAEAIKGLDEAMGGQQKALVSHGETLEAHQEWLEQLDKGPAVEQAVPGQLLAVKTVDEAGQPTEWEAVDPPRSGGLPEKELAAGSADYTGELYATKLNFPELTLDMFHVGQTIIVYDNNTRYEGPFIRLTTSDGEEALGAGDPFTDDFPFLVAVFGDGGMTLSFDDKASHTVRVCLYDKLPEDVLPDIGGIALEQAAPGQMIIVKAVNDAGQPTAWEAVDRTHWTEGGGATVLPETTIAGEEDLAKIPALGLAAGEAYTVNLEGTAYPCVAWEIQDGDYTAVGLGDIYTATDGAVGTAPTGEPFVLYEFPPELAAEAGINVMVQPLSDSIVLPVTFSITGGDEVVHKLDNKYLDLDWLPVWQGKEVIPEYTGETFAVGEVNTFEIPNTAGILSSIANGTNVLVDINGVRYSATKTSNLDGFYIPVNDEYSLYALTPYVNAGFYSTVPGTYTVRLITEGENGNKIPEEFLPDSVATVEKVLAALPTWEGGSY